jgi:putative inorganic carbon (hco3(-)) transporter
MTSRLLAAPGLMAGHELRSRLAFALAAAGAGLAAGVAPAMSGAAAPQLVAASGLLVAVAAAHARSRTAGLLCLWTLWLIAPGIRRVLGMSGEYLSADPLALVPFLATAAVALIELSRTALPTRVRGLLALAAAGYLIGVPLGVQSPQAAVFALLAYGSALLAVTLGLADAGREPALSRALLVLAVPLSAYGFDQYFGGLPEWDRIWLESVDFVATGAPEEGRIRVFSTLNSPGTLAAVLGLAIVAGLARPALGVWRAAAIGATFVALALTYVRSAWLAIMAAGLAYVVLTRGRGAGRVALAAAGCVLLVAALTALSPATADAISDRFGTLGSLEEDRSANERVDLRLSLVPAAASTPLGHGLGQVGEATRLGATGGLTASDNGYLALLYQVGPIGFLLVAVAIAGLTAPLFRRVWRERGRDPVGVFLATALVFLLVLLAAGDVLYGVTGVAFWYLLGRGWRWAGVTGGGADGRRAEG